jgi:hypothetical protein
LSKRVNESINRSDQDLLPTIVAFLCCLGIRVFLYRTDALSFAASFLTEKLCGRQGAVCHEG